MKYSGQTAVITGAASGIGLLCAQCYAAEGGNVVMVDVNEAVLEREAETINAQGGGRALAARCDVREYDQVAAVCERAVAQFGRIDLLVNAAGGAELRLRGLPGNSEFPDVPMEVFDWSIDINLKGQVHFAHAVMKYMREQRSGVIINFGSISAEVGCQYNVGYSAAKSGAMNGLTKSLARYGAQYNIRCCCVTPGPVLTRPGMAALKTPLGRAAQPQEIVDLILYLASDSGSFIIGTNILIDGGFSVVN